MWVVVGLFATRQQSQSSQFSSESSVTQQDSSSVSSASPEETSNSQEFVQSQDSNNSIPEPVVTKVPSPAPYFPPPSSISQEQAVELIDTWLQAKRVMFAPPYNRQAADEITTGEHYKKAVGMNGTIDWLKSSNAYYKYGVQNIEGVDIFAVNDNQATIQLRVTEDRTFYRNGKIDAKETDFKTRRVRYSLELSDGQWKIASSQILH